MNSKKLITLLVLTTLLLGMVPIAPVSGAILNGNVIDVDNDDKAAWSEDDVGAGNVPRGEKGHEMHVFGPADQVASGYEVLLYWDKIDDWDGVKGFLNTTEVDSDGGFEIWFDVPEAKAGSHYVWMTATDQETKISFKFTVVPDCDLSTASGLAGSKIYVDLWGFKNSKEVAVLFTEDRGTTPNAPATDWNDVAVTTPETLYTVTAADVTASKVVFSSLATVYAPLYTATGHPLTISVSGDNAGSYVNGAWAVAGDAGDEIVPGGCSINTATGVYCGVNRNTYGCTDHRRCLRGRVLRRNW